MRPSSSAAAVKLNKRRVSITVRLRKYEAGSVYNVNFYKRSSGNNNIIFQTTSNRRRVRIKRKKFKEISNRDEGRVSYNVVIPSGERTDESPIRKFNYAPVE